MRAVNLLHVFPATPNRHVILITGSDMDPSEIFGIPDINYLNRCAFPQRTRHFYRGTMSSQPTLVKDESKQTSQPRAKKRRAARACERCRAKKYKCDESFPCRKCVSKLAECTIRPENMILKLMRQRLESKVECVYEGDFHLQRDSQAARQVFYFRKTSQFSVGSSR